MKKILLSLAFLLASTTVFAQNTSTTQMQLVNSSIFTNRLQYLEVQQARLVLLEAASDNSHSGADTGANAADLNYTTSCHTARAAYANNVISAPAAYAGISAVLIVSANFADSVIVGTVVGGNDSSASDLALTNAIKHNWNALSKCVTNP